jgi:hypothetical protein
MKTAETCRRIGHDLKQNSRWQQPPFLSETDLNGQQAAVTVKAYSLQALGSIVS